MSARRKTDGGFDFFAFQDIVTTTTGILIIMALLLALTIGANRLEQAGVSETQAEQLVNLSNELQSREAAFATMQALEAELAGYVEAEIQGMKTESRPSVVPEDSNTYALQLPQNGPMSDPVIVIVEGQVLSLQDNSGNRIGSHLLLAGSANETVTRALSHCIQQENKGGVLFLVKPSAFDLYREILDLGRGNSLQGQATGFPFTIELIEENWRIQIHSTSDETP